VAAFDEPAGIGEIVGDDDRVKGSLFPFQCVEIADGSRAIDVGQAVRFHPLPRFGVLQAGGIVKL
jgi:hypothetical protein